MPTTGKLGGAQAEKYDTTARAEKGAMQVAEIRRFIGNDPESIAAHYIPDQEKPAQLWFRQDSTVIYCVWKSALRRRTL